MQIRAEVTSQILDQGLEAVLQAINTGAKIHSATLCLALERGHKLTAAVLLALGLSKQSAIELATSKGQPTIVEQLTALTIGRDVLKAILYWAITHYKKEQGLELINRLLIVKKSILTPETTADYLKEIRGFLELTTYLHKNESSTDFIPVIQALRKISPPARSDKSIRTALYWLIIRDWKVIQEDRSLLEYVRTDEQEWISTLSQLHEDGYSDQFNYCLGMGYTKLLGLSSEVVENKFAEEKRVTSPFNTMASAVYGTDAILKKEKLAQLYNAENHFIFVQTALERNDFVMLTELNKHYYPHNQALIVRALKPLHEILESIKQATDPLVVRELRAGLEGHPLNAVAHFALISFDISLLDMCLLLRRHDDLKLMHFLLSTYWSLESVLQNIISRNLTGSMSSQDAELFNRLEKTDASVQSALHRCLSECYPSTEFAPHELSSFYQKFDILIHSKDLKESKEEKTSSMSDVIETGLPGNLPEDIWNELTLEYIYGMNLENVPKLRNQGENNETLAQANELEIKVDSAVESKVIAPIVRYKGEDDPKYLNRKFYSAVTLTTSEEFRRNLEKVRAEQQTLRHFSRVLEAEYKLKGNCSNRAWPIKYIIALLAGLATFGSNARCLVRLREKENAFIDLLQSIPLIEYGNQTCFDKYMQYWACTTHIPMTEVCREDCDSLGKYSHYFMGSCVTMIALGMGSVIGSGYLGHFLSNVTFASTRETHLANQPIADFSPTVREEIENLGDHRSLATGSVSQTRQAIDTALTRKNEQVVATVALIGFYSKKRLTSADDEKRSGVIENNSNSVNKEADHRTPLLSRPSARRPKGPCGGCVIL